MQIYSFAIPLGISPCTCGVDPFSFHFSSPVEISIHISQNKEAHTIVIDTHWGQQVHYTSSCILERKKIWHSNTLHISYQHTGYLFILGHQRIIKPCKSTPKVYIFQKAKMGPKGKNLRFLYKKRHWHEVKYTANCCAGCNNYQLCLPRNVQY